MLDPNPDWDVGNGRNGGRISLKRWLVVRRRVSVGCGVRFWVVEVPSRGNKGTVDDVVLTSSFLEKIMTSPNITGVVQYSGVSFVILKLSFSPTCGNAMGVSHFLFLPRLFPGVVGLFIVLFCFVL